jgi:hypothetical protein
MKQFILALCCISLFSGCFILRRKVVYGCPTDGRNIGAEKLASGDAKLLKVSKSTREAIRTTNSFDIAKSYHQKGFFSILSRIFK